MGWREVSEQVKSHSYTGRENSGVLLHSGATVASNKVLHVSRELEEKILNHHKKLQMFKVMDILITLI